MRYSGHARLVLAQCALLAFCLFLSGCRDGEDGHAYLTLDWDWYVDAYTDDNPGLPPTIDRRATYRVQPGTYYFSFDCSDGLGNYWGYNGAYTITINKGSKGGLFSAGDDGADRYFTLWLSGDGAGFTGSKNGVELPENSGRAGAGACMPKRDGAREAQLPERQSRLGRLRAEMNASTDVGELVTD